MTRDAAASISNSGRLHELCPSLLFLGLDPSLIFKDPESHGWDETQRMYRDFQKNLVHETDQGSFMTLRGEGL